MHEIVTIQCGNVANYVGTHFWNFQDPTDEEASKDIDHDVLFAAGQARNGMATYTPRLLIYDRAKNFGSMRRINALFEEPETSTEGIDVLRQETFPDHAFQQSLEELGVPETGLLSDDNVRFWSDYNTQFYHPQSYLPLDSTASTTDYGSFESGRSAYHERSRRQDVLDTDLRPFLEACDLPQGFNVLADLTDACWSGYTAELLLDLDHECPKLAKFLLSTTTRPGTRPGDLNAALALHACHDLVDLLVPLDARASWSGSAAAARWLDSFTVPLRARPTAALGPLRMPDLASLMTYDRRLLHPGRPAGAHAEGRLSVVRRAAAPSLTSAVRAGTRQHVFRHPSVQTLPASFPAAVVAGGDDDDDDDRPTEATDSGGASRRYVRGLAAGVGAIRGARGYEDRKDLVSALDELCARYTIEDELDSDDDDGEGSSGDEMD